MNDKNMVLYGGLGFMAGLAVGTGVGLVIAPHSGAHTRRHLKVLASDLTERITELGQEALEATQRLTKRGPRWIADTPLGRGRNGGHP